MLIIKKRCQQNYSWNSCPVSRHLQEHDENAGLG